MSGTCPVVVRYMLGVRPNMYRTYSEQLADKDIRYKEGITRLRYRYIGDEEEVNR